MNRFWMSSSVPRLLLRSSTSPLSSHLRRHISNESVEKLRNVWISGLIDPSNTTLPEREMLYLSLGLSWDWKLKKFRKTKESRPLANSLLGLENTSIQSVITFVWGYLTLIDTYHSLVDETTLRAFDSAVLVLSSLHGVQTQSIHINQHMTRFQLARLIYINNFDQDGANPLMVVDEVKSKLHHRCAAVQVPIAPRGDCFTHLVDLVKLESYNFQDSNRLTEEDDAAVDKYMETCALEKRLELIETVSEVDDKLAEAFRSGNEISASDLDDAIRRATIARKFVPIFMGSDKYKRDEGIRLLLNGVEGYLPSPMDVRNYALDQTKNGEKVELSGSIDGPFVALAFTMEHRRLSKLTYLRIYQGVIRKGDFITNVSTGKKIKVTYLFKRYSDVIDDEIDEAYAGQILGVLDADCSPGDTFTDGSVRLTMT